MTCQASWVGLKGEGILYGSVLCRCHILRLMRDAMWKIHWLTHFNQCLFHFLVSLGTINPRGNQPGSDSLMRTMPLTATAVCHAHARCQRIARSWERKRRNNGLKISRENNEKGATWYRKMWFHRLEYFNHYIAFFLKGGWFRNQVSSTYSQISAENYWTTLKLQG